MPRTFYQLAGTTGACGIASVVEGRVCDETGPTVAATITVDSGATNSTEFRLTGLPSFAAWASADYDIVVNVVAANMNMTLTELNVLRYDSSCVFQGSLGAAVVIDRSMGSTGSQTHTLAARSAQSGAVSGDKFVVGVAFTNTAMSAQSVDLGITVTTTAFDAPAEPLPRGTVVIRQAVMRATLH